MVLQEESFKNALLSMRDIPEGDDTLDGILQKENVPENEKAEVRRIFQILIRVMRAKSSLDLADVVIDDLLKCFTWQPVFEAYFSSKKAGHYFSIFSGNVRKVPTVRKRRVL